MKYTYVIVPSSLYLEAEKHLPRHHFKDLFEFRFDMVTGEFAFNIDKFDALSHNEVLNSIKLDNGKIKHWIPLLLTLIIMNLFYLISLNTTLGLFYPTFLFIVLATTYSIIISINTHRMIRESNATNVLFDMIRLSSQRTDVQIHGLLIKATNAETYNGNTSQ